MFKRWILRWADKIRMNDHWADVADEVSPKRSRRGLTSNGPTPTPSNRRVEHNYDDETVITFKVYGANGGKIVETARYDDKKDNESIRRYVIDENADLAESLGRIVTMEYLR